MSELLLLFTWESQSQGGFCIVDKHEPINVTTGVWGWPNDRRNKQTDNDRGLCSGVFLKEAFVANRTAEWCGASSFWSALLHSSPQSYTGVSNIRLVGQNRPAKRSNQGHWMTLQRVKNCREVIDSNSKFTTLISEKIRVLLLLILPLSPRSVTLFFSSYICRSRSNLRLPTSSGQETLWQIQFLIFLE